MRVAARTLAGVLLTLAFTAQALHAGTVYVPLPGVASVGPAGYETQITITNTLAQQRTLNYLQLASGIDGTKRQGMTPTQLPIAATRAFVLKPAAARGLLELNGPLGLQYSARLVRTGAGGFGVELPVVSSDNMGKADETLVLQGLKGSTTLITDVVMVNLSQQATTCSALIVRADGTSPFPSATITLLPLSHLFFTNVFQDIPNGIADARVEVSCKADFYIYAQMSDTATGEFAIATPSLSSDSLLTAPGDKPAGLACSTGTQCYVFSGLVHTSTKADPDRSIVLTPPVFAYSSVKVRFEVTVGPWNKPTTGAHGLLYFVRNRNKDMYANIFLRGPSKNNLTLRHGFNQEHGEKAKIEKGFAAQTGTTYLVEYEYNPVADFISLKMSNLAGQLLFEIRDKPNVNRVHIDEGDRVILGLSNPGTSSVEPASLGFQWRNMKVEFFP
jgi:hypothetical protein